MTRYNETLRDLVKIGPFDAFCPPSGHFLKKRSQKSHTGTYHSFVASRLLLRSDYIQKFVTATATICMEEVLY